MKRFEHLYIGGTWMPSAGTGMLEVVDPTTEEVLATIPAGVPEDVDRAVAAARAAFAQWADTPALERGKLLRRVANEMTARSNELADIITHELGMPRSQTLESQVFAPIAVFGEAAELAETYAFENDQPGLVVREPIGVVGCITPWNYPLTQTAMKVAYAMAAGCTVVWKPSEVASMSAFVLAEVFDEVEVPAGVFNLVTGVGPVVGEVLAAHPDVDMISFTGSTRAGKRVAELASQSVKRVALELGGKSPNVLLDDADFASAVGAGIADAFGNSGQTCTALTRMIVPRSRLAEVEELARAAAESYTVGDPFAEATQLGPLVSSAQRERVRGYINRGIEEGATLLTGGAEAPKSLPTGYFVKPTVFSNVTHDMTIAREEIFGPVLSIMAYDTEDEAVEIANDTVYGLAAAVSGSDARAWQVARRIRAGHVLINGGPYFGGAPFGGYKQSGLGREGGRYGFEEFLELKALYG